MTSFRSLLVLLVSLFALFGRNAHSAPVFETVTTFSGVGGAPSGRLHLHTDGNFYGPVNYTIQGAINRLTPSGDVTPVIRFTNNVGPAKGAGPGYISHTDSNGLLWGTTNGGGQNYCGTIYTFNPVTNAVTTVLDFNGTNGQRPLPGLYDDGAGYLWGTLNEAGISISQHGKVFKYHVATSTITHVATFTGKDGALKGSTPLGSLASDGNGFLWGVTVEGGVNSVPGCGTIFKVNLATGETTNVIQFTDFSGAALGSNPSSPLFYDGNGHMWGTTMYGGQHFSGTLFKVNVNTGVLTTVTEFNGNAGNYGCAPEGPLASDGNGYLWGTLTLGGSASSGGIYKVHMETGVVTPILSFTGITGAAMGRKPNSGLVPDGQGNFWGTTVEGGTADSGTAFKINFTSGQLTTMSHYVGPSGPTNASHPRSGLVGGPLGWLWGTNFYGGAYGKGSIYKVNPITGEVVTMAEFSGTTGSTKGARPESALTFDNEGWMWGITREGGAGNYGTIYRIHHSGTFETKIEFTNITGAAKGSYSESTLLQVGDFMWGTTAEGGTAPIGRGTVFKLNRLTGEFTTVVQFTGTTGAAIGSLPQAGLVSDGNGFLWGTTYTGGTTDNGTIFKVNAETGDFTSVLSFTKFDAPNRGANPRSALVKDLQGNLWGTTFYGGVWNVKSTGWGTIFKINITSGALTTYDFNNTSSNRGCYPDAGLAFDSNGQLWGTTFGGNGVNGGDGFGTIFRIQTNGSFAHQFDFTEFAGNVPGASPAGAVLYRHIDGNLYGTVPSAGNTGNGVFDASGSVYRIRFGPTPTTQAATNIVANSVKLRGTLNPNGAQTTATFEWGVSPELIHRQTLIVGTVGSGTSPQNVSATLSGISSGTTYYYRIVGTNLDNTEPQLGTIFSFTTPQTAIHPWKMTYLGSPNAHDWEDPDLDRIVNVIEYATCRLPGVSDSSFSAEPYTYAEGERLRMFVTRDPNRNDVVIMVETAPLVSGPWTAVATSTNGAPFIGAGYFAGEVAGTAVRTVEIRDTVNLADSTTRMMRIRVTR